MTITLTVGVQILACIGVIAILLVAIYKSMTFNPTYNEIEERERLNGTKQKKFVTRACSQPVPVNVAESYRQAHGKDYPYEYTVNY